MGINAFRFAPCSSVVSKTTLMMGTVVTFLLLFVCLLSTVAARPELPNTDKSANQNKVAQDYAKQSIHTGSGSSSFFDDVIREEPTAMGRNGILDPQRHWPGGRIPYVISPEYTNEEQLVIREAVDEFTRQTDSCIRLEPRQESDVNFVEYVPKEKGCSAALGMVGQGAQTTNLDKTSDCVNRHIVLHETMHAVGFEHEQNRPDRDDYVIIHWENIEPERQSDYKKLSSTEYDPFGAPYDFGSVMHYPPYGSSGKPVITAKAGVPTEFGWAKNLSASDVYRIKKMYECLL